MPVFIEGDEQKRSRKWLWILAIMPAIFTGLLLVPVIRPVYANIGGRAIVIYCADVPGAMRDGYYQFDLGSPSNGVIITDVGFPARLHGYPNTDAVHTRCFKFNRWCYQVTWFRGQVHVK